jgi:cytochrome P450
MTTQACARFLALDEEIGRAPHQLFAALRERPGVFHEETADVYVVTRHADIHQVLQNPVLFSSADALGPQIAQMMGDAAQALPPEQLAHLLAPTEILCADGERHARLRRLTNSAFTTAASRRWEPVIREVCSKLLTDAATLPSVEWVSGFARPVTTQTIAHIIGVPAADHSRFAAWNTAMVDLVNGTQITPDILADYLANATEFTDYFHQRVTELRRAPADNLLSRLVHASEDGDRLTDEELVKLCLILLSAGSETTVGLLTSATLRLAEDPQLVTALRKDPGRLVPAFIEEVLRLDSPAQAMFRTATAGTRIGQTEIPAGAHLLLVFSSANRDPAVFAAGDEPDLQQSTTSHLAFGRGIHRCLGAAVARAEGRVAVEELLSHCESIALTRNPEELPFRPHLIGPGLQELHVALTPRKTP